MMARTRSGASLVILAAVETIMRHGVPRQLAWNVDITDRRRDEESLRRFGVVLRDSNDAVTVYDLQGRILAWNPAAERQYGWTEAEALGMNIRELIPAGKRAEVSGVLERLTRGETVDPFDTERITKTGKMVDVRLTMSTLQNAGGSIYGIATTERLLGAARRRRHS